MTRKDNKTFDTDTSAAFFKINTALEIWGTNKTLTDKKVAFEARCFDLDDDKWSHTWSEDVVLSANSSTEIFSGNLPGQLVRTKDSEAPKPIIISARLLDQSTGAVLARYANW